MIAVLCWLWLSVAHAEPVTLTLDEALALAAAQSPEIQATGIAPRLGAAAVDAARAPLLPGVSGQMGAGYGNDVRARVGDGQGGNSFATNLSVNATFPLVNVQALANLRATARQALATEDLARFQVELALADVAARYIALQTIRQSVETTRQRAQEAEQLAATAQRRVDLGVEPAVVATRAALAERQAALSAIRAVTAEEAARVRLAQALGLELDAAIVVAPTAPLLPNAEIPWEDQLTAAIAEAMERPEVRAARARRDAAAASRSAAWAAAMPTISGYAQMSEINGTNAFGIASGRTAGAVGATANVPIYAGGARLANLEAAKANLAGAETAVAIVERAAETDVRLAWRVLRDAGTEWTIAEEAAALAREELDRAQRAWEAGAVDHLAVVAAQTGLAAAQLQREQSLGNYNLAVIDWRRARGRLLH